MSSAPLRPRYGRIAALVGSVMVTSVAGLGALGVASSGPAAVADDTARAASYHAPSTTPTTDPTTDPTSAASSSSSTTPGFDPHTPTPPGFGTAQLHDQKALPSGTGTGRRIVFSQHLQRVWLVGAHDDKVQRTYLVSGSRTDNLQPGHYAVTDRQRHAIGIDDSGTMQYFVVFTAGPTGAAIGFHSIPVKNGHDVQSVARLGTPTSHGCIRQATPDAIALWGFGSVGTKVVVVA